MKDTVDFKKIMEELNKKNLNLSERSIPFHQGFVKIYFIKQLTDRSALTLNVVKPLILYCSSGNKTINAQTALNSIIFADECSLQSDFSRIKDFLLSGLTIILFSKDKNYISVDFNKIEQRQISQPIMTYSLRGAQDCFTENLETNISLVRYRIKDENLRIKFFEVGRRTKTRVAMIYINDIANERVVDDIQNKIERIDVDGIGESGELQALLCNKKQLFPQMGLIERSDMAFHSLLEGKVILLVEGSGIALLAPKIFPEFFYSCDDRYDNKYSGMFARFIRYAALFIAFTSSSFLVAITSFHTDVLPGSYAISLAEMDLKVPFSTFVAMLLLEFIVELLKEALFRVPKPIGPAIGIVGAIIIGQAAIAAGIFSPLTLIIISISMLSSFAIPDYTIVTPFRLLKFALLLSTGFLGFYGFTLFILILSAELVSLESFGVPYMAPIAPFNLKDFKSIFINNITVTSRKPNYLKTRKK